MRITRMVVMLLAVIFSKTSFGEEVACKGNYSPVFHPEGMRIVEGWNGNSKHQVFTCYTEVVLPRNLVGVVYSDKTNTGFSDDLYTVKLALISTSVESPKVLQLLDLADVIPVHVEQPGNFYRMNAIGEIVKGSNGLLILHVNVWAVISGSGAISGGSDLFYLLQQNQLLPMLEIHNSSSFSKENISNSSQKISDIFFDSAKGATRIYVQTKKVSFVNGEAKKANPTLTTYELRGKKFESIPFDGKLPLSAVKLKMVSEIVGLSSLSNAN